MLAFIKRHFGSLLVAVALYSPFIWRGLVWLWDWAARLDFIATHVRDAREISGMIGFLTNPPPWAIFPITAFAVGIVLWDIRYKATLRPATTPRNYMAIFLGAAIICLIGSIGFGAAAYWRYKNPPPPEPTETELYKRAKGDFRLTGGVATETEKIDFLPDRADEITVTVWVCSDLISMAKFLVFYIPHTFDMPTFPPMGNFPSTRLTYETIKKLADRYPEIMKRAEEKGGAGSGDMGAENWRYSSEAIFAGAIYIYYEGSLTETERVELRQYYKDRGAKAYFRDHRYMVESRAPLPR